MQNQSAQGSGDRKYEKKYFIQSTPKFKKIAEAMVSKSKIFIHKLLTEKLNNISISTGPTSIGSGSRDKKDEKKKYEPPVPTRVGKKKPYARLWTRIGWSLVGLCC